MNMSQIIFGEPDKQREDTIRDLVLGMAEVLDGHDIHLVLAAIADLFRTTMQMWTDESSGIPLTAEESEAVHRITSGVAAQRANYRSSLMAAAIVAKGECDMHHEFGDLMALMEQGPEGMMAALGQVMSEMEGTVAHE